jgi:hypothetical protein
VSTARPIPPDPRLAEPVRAAIARYLSALDGAAPGIVEGLFVTGSLALDDYQHGTSDIDFVALSSRSLDAPDLENLRAAHSTLGARHFDGIYLDRATFEAMPDDERVIPHVHEGVLHSQRPCGDLNPVLWRTLERYQLVVREPVRAVRIRAVDETRLRTWCASNLQSYWLPLATRLRSAVASHDDEALVDTSAVVWAALGPGRLHCTITTGDIISKTAAGAYTARHLPQFAPLLDRAVAARSGAEARFTVRDARSAAELVEKIARDPRS